MVKITERLLKDCLEQFAKIEAYAKANQTCLRKAVGCSLVTVDYDELDTLVMVHNGPTRRGHQCLNIVGGCGCGHSEPRAILYAAKKLTAVQNIIMFCTYSPCTNCANIILDSGLISGVCYDILTEHDKRGAEFLADAMPVVTKAEIEALLQTTESMESVCDKIKRW